MGTFWVMGTYIVAQWALTLGFTEVAVQPSSQPSVRTRPTASIR